MRLRTIICLALLFALCLADTANAGDAGVLLDFEEATVDQEIVRSYGAEFSEHWIVRYDDDPQSPMSDPPSPFQAIVLERPESMDVDRVTFRIAVDSVSFYYSVDAVGTMARFYAADGTPLGEEELNVCGSTECGAACARSIIKPLCSWATLRFESPVDDPPIAYFELWFAEGLTRMALDNLQVRQRAVSSGIREQPWVGQAPIGAVLMYFGDPADLPSGWRLCDGSLVDDLSSPLHNVLLPDFRSRLPRGEALADYDLIRGGLHARGEDGALGRVYGTSEAGAHTHDAEASSHTHSIPGTTGSISAAAGGLAITDYYIYDDHHPVWTTRKHLEVSDGEAANEGHHRHDMPSSVSGGASGTCTVDPVPDHTHTVDLAESAMSEQKAARANLPRYVGVHFIIRIR